MDQNQDAIQVDLLIAYVNKQMKIQIEYHASLKDIIDNLIDQSQLERDGQDSYGIYDNFNQKLYQGEELLKQINQICKNQNMADLIIVRRDEFTKYTRQIPSISHQIKFQQQLSKSLEPPSDDMESNENTIKIKVKTIDEPQQEEFILEINNNQNYYQLEQKLYQHWGLTRDGNLELYLGDEKMNISEEKKQNRCLFDLGIVNGTEIKVKKKSNMIKIKVKIIDGAQIDELIIDINQNATWDSFIDLLYQRQGLSKDVVEFQLFLNQNLIQVQSKGQRPLFQLGIVNNSEIEVKRNWKGGANCKK